MDIKNTESYKNIKLSFQNEAQAIVRYMIYAEVARNEGDEKAAELFDRMAINEIAHAKVWFKFLQETPLTTMDNVKSAASNENDEWKNIYPTFAEKAKQEGLNEIADLFQKISSIEYDHERRFIEYMLSNSDDAPKKEKEKKYCICIFCGYHNDENQEVCPVCGSRECFVNQ